MTERIQFCKNCTKRKFDNKIGIICGLTNKKSKFENECLEFEVDAENIQKHKERLEYNPKKWKRSDNKFSESTKSLMKFDLFELEPRVGKIVLRKSRFDKISMACISGYIFAMFYLITGDSKFIENIMDIGNQMIGALILIYPIIRYFLPFKKYELDSQGIQINDKLKVDWTGIKAVNNYVTIDNEDDSISTVYLYLVLNDYKNIRISLDNYTFEDSLNLKSGLKRNGIKLNSKEILESIILSFHKRYNEKNRA